MLEQDTGWLSPEGEFFPCKHYEHISKAEDLCKLLGISEDVIYDDELLKRGWAKLGISLLGNKQFYIRWERKLTNQQRYELKDLVENPNPKLPVDSLTLSLWKYEDDIL